MGKNGEKWGIYFMGNRENRLGNSPFFPIGSPPSTLACHNKFVPTPQICTNSPNLFQLPIMLYPKLIDAFPAGDAKLCLHTGDRNAEICKPISCESEENIDFEIPR